MQKHAELLDHVLNQGNANCRRFKHLAVATWSHPRAVSFDGPVGSARAIVSSRT